MEVPCSGGRLELRVSPDVRRLRDYTRELHRGGAREWVESLPLTAKAWAEHGGEKDWLVWRGHWAATRLTNMKIEILPDERLVGRPALRKPTEADKAEIARAEAALVSMPGFPGGDTGHFHPDYEKLFRVGLGGLLAEARQRMADADPGSEQRAFYAACAVALNGMAGYFHRVADACAAMAVSDSASPARWTEKEAMCRRLASEPPSTFREAIQLMHMTLVALWFGESHNLTCPGRMDQTLRRFYEADLRAGKLTPQEAFDLICSLYVETNLICGPGLAVAVMVGGRDGAGRDVTNDLTYLCLAARRATNLVYPTVGLAWHEGAPSELMDFCVKMLSTGIGCPAFFNDELIAQGLRDHGVSEADSFNYMNSTCVEIKVVGSSNIWVTAPYINCPKAVLDAMDHVASGQQPEPACYGEFTALVRKELSNEIRIAAQDRHQAWLARERQGGLPLASCFTRDCLARGRDIDRGGALYNWVENSFVGLANLVDSMLAVKRLTYEDKAFSLTDLRDALKKNFEGHEQVRQQVLTRIPKYGNDHDEADALAEEWTGFLMDQTESHTVGVHRYVPGFFCWVKHERMGRETGATPDGRLAGLALADGAGPAQGRERSGPTAAVLSVTKWPHRRVLGGLVYNAKLSANMFRTAADRNAVRALIETYLRRGGFEAQLNVVSQADLLDAQKRPERHLDLIVRVAGYSDYFVHLNKNAQDEVIARTPFAAVGA